MTGSVNDWPPLGIRVPQGFPLRRFLTAEFYCLFSGLRVRLSSRVNYAAS